MEPALPSQQLQNSSLLCPMGADSTFCCLPACLPTSLIISLYLQCADVRSLPLQGGCRHRCVSHQPHRSFSNSESTHGWLQRQLLCCRPVPCRRDWHLRVAILSHHKLPCAWARPRRCVYGVGTCCRQWRWQPLSSRRPIICTHATAWSPCPLSSVCDQPYDCHRDCKLSCKLNFHISECKLLCLLNPSFHRPVACLERPLVLLAVYIQRCA